jgi:hypothetical protein
MAVFADNVEGVALELDQVGDVRTVLAILHN